MLVLGRKIGESIIIPELRLTLKIVRVKGNRVSLGIMAPKSVRVFRAEVQGLLHTNSEHQEADKEIS